MRRIAASALALTALLGAPALAQSAGTWATTATTPQGTFTSTWTLVDGETDTIEVADAPPPGAPAGAPPMESTISDVVIDGGAFSFKRVLTTPQGPIELSYTGTVDGDTMTGSATSSFGAVPFTGTRQ